ncbi:hypothetical protein CMV_000439 [Castanea mollissima]|uniref:Uncharacterized protein n=1 Tax=Castanea mollissima TaxID=60419 RepID=A0A8J4S1F2_9ROSI|nr:hypothetical protein CMV_000439 [Castanea mollissima]
MRSPPHLDGELKISARFGWKLRDLHQIWAGNSRSPLDMDGDHEISTGSSQHLLLSSDCVLLQFLVSKLVACCIPSEANGENSGTRLSQELEPFPEIDIFDKIRKFHQEFCRA